MAEGRSRAPDFVLMGVTVLWGSTFVVTKSVVRSTAPLDYLLLRFGVAAVLLLPFALLRPVRARGRRSLLVDGLVLGLLNSAGLVLQVFGQAYTTASKSSFITSLNTPLTPLVGLLLYRTIPAPAQRIAIVVATAGLLLLTYPVPDALGAVHWNRGDLATVGCAIIYSITIVEIARRTPGHDAVHITAVQLVVGALLFGAAWLAMRGVLHAVPLSSLPEFAQLEARPFVVDARLVASGLYMAVVCTLLTFLLQTWAMAQMSATRAAVMFALEPLWATALALCVDGASEWPGRRSAVGAAIVLSAVLISELAPKRRLAD